MVQKHQNTENPDLYAKLGVDADKSAVRKAFKPIIDNEYPGAWVNIITAPYTDGKMALTQHCDGDGSKMVQRLLHYLETGNAKQLGYALDDALSMNASDVAASGFVNGEWILTQIINSGLPEDLKKILMNALAERWLELRELYKEYGFRISFLGGETADLPDQVRSAVFDMTITAYARKEHIIKGNVLPGDRIWGFASDGRAVWETEENSGLMSNGLTLARSSLMLKEYDKLYPSLKRSGKYYQGRFATDIKLNILSGLAAGEALLSPTRQWPIVISKLINKLIDANSLELLRGISINTGGGAAKIRNLGHGIIYVKNMPKPAPLFRLIQDESKQDWRYMFKTFNCGVGIDVVGEGGSYLGVVLRETAEECGLKLYDLGLCLKNGISEEDNAVILKTEYGNFQY